MALTPRGINTIEDTTPEGEFGSNFWLDIRAELRRADSEIFSRLDSAIPDEVTHYTSLAGLEGIIATGDIWCTDLRHVNGDRECDYGMDVIRNAMARKSVPADFIQYVLRNKTLFGTKERFTFFISCFCSSQDAERMWRDYAERGSGCAIVFDARTLLTASDGGKAYAFAPVIYDERIQLDKTTAVIDHAIQLQRQWNLPWRRYWADEVRFWLLVCGFRFKAPRWHPEQEVRIAVAERDSLKLFSHAGKMRVAVTFQRSAIVRIIRGPNAALGTEQLIRDMLNRAAYDREIPIL